MERLSISTPIFVSGATGYIASHIIKSLLEQNYKVRGSVRSLSNTKKNQFLFELVPEKSANLSLVEAELTDPKSWTEALKNIEYLIHVASPIPPYQPKDENEIIIPAVTGTTNVLNAALENNVKKVVVTSSCLAIALFNPGKVCNEDDWSDVTKISHYPKSKVLAEKAAWEFYHKHMDKITITVVNPSLVLGPGLTAHGNSSEALIAEILSGKFPGIPNYDLGYRIVDVRDAAEAHIKALFNESTNGKRYIVSSDKVLYFKDLVGILKEEFAKYGYILPEQLMTKEELIAHGGIAARTAAMGSVVMQLNNERGVKELGMKYREWRDTLVDMGIALSKNGIIENKIKN